MQDHLRSSQTIQRCSGYPLSWMARFRNQQLRDRSAFTSTERRLTAAVSGHVFRAFFIYFLGDIAKLSNGSVTAEQQCHGLVTDIQQTLQEGSGALITGLGFPLTVPNATWNLVGHISVNLKLVVLTGFRFAGIRVVNARDPA